MEDPQPNPTSSQTSLYALIFFIFLLVLNITTTRDRKRKNLPPGPPKLPLLGNMHQLGRLPHRTLTTLAEEYGPLMHLKLGQIETIVVSSPELAQQVLKAHDVVFASRPAISGAKHIAYNCKDLVMAPYGAYWRSVRKICIMELLSAKRVRSFCFVREEETTHLVESIAEASYTHINLTHRIFSLVSSIVERVSLGKKYAGDEFRDIIRETLEISGGFDIEDLYPSMGFLGLLSSTRARMKKIHMQFDCFLDKVIEEHLKSGRKHVGEQGDLVSVLLRFQEEGDGEIELTNDNIKAIILDMFVAGIETSSATLTWAMAELMKNPKVMEKAQREIRHALKGKAKVEESDLEQLEYLKLVLKETLRLHPPVPLLVPRESMEKCTLEGYQIPAKTRVFVNAWAIGRCSNVYENAEKFEPERFSDSLVDYKGHRFDYIPFGGGRRGCPGALFGMATAQIALAQLLFYFDWKLPHGLTPEELDMTENIGITLPMKNDLILIPISHCTSSKCA
ncbi:hypothetical protein AMTRI_Chr10g2010 [Amborella trichopoda]|uniref:Cytochrome P450 n=1 Tax=Amborella trichopoda TaxID=13333 RepID=U5D632_AMBTC|nr:cytochrome P450 71A1 [Amborella trichopoda]ERN17909.1 hypothetical protein AMTR_s00047p00229040 [Amborella trichopoda]|eukprot:XP_006856442.1 cytochrome P450 71A1 [Amborella trichopoda]